MDKLKMHSINKVDDNIVKIGELFPNCLTERINENGEVEQAIDFDVLKQELSFVIVEGNEERYQFTWPDKKKSILLANAPTSKTLRPCREESVAFDDTENLYIEGDNLEVLKLLQETYLGKIKMIYIDPPYNTGRDFVYEDNFVQSVESFLNNSAQFDDEGKRLVHNTESNGRFHTDWLNMIYPRLKLAKDLLSDDGVVFISIDEHEVANLEKICDEVFGRSNYISNMVWKSKSGGANDVNSIACDSENVLVYAKNINTCIMYNDLEAEVTTNYNNIDTDGRRYSLDRLDKQSLGYHETLDFPIIGPDGETYVVQHKNPNNKVARWRWGKETVAQRYDELVFKYPYVYTKNYEKEKGGIPRNLMVDERFGRTRTGKTEVATLFDKVTYFDFPKPTKMIKFLLSIATSDDDYILDFFSGSSTTAHATMLINSEDSGKRKFIMVQLPELTDMQSVAFKNGYKNICEIGKERIRRAGKKITDENPLVAQNLDIGFRVLKLDSSNMKDVYYNPTEYQSDLFGLLTNNIKEDRAPEDLLFQVMLDLGVLLSSKIEETVIAGKKVFNVADNFLIACFDNDVNEEAIKTIAQQKPYYFVMRDSAMSSDSVAANFEQIFATYSPDTVRKVL